MNPKALFNFSYGLYVITSKKGDKVNGQIGNTVFQISSDPATIAVSINKNNLTHEYIKDSKTFTVSILSQDVPLNLIGQFGFKSGRESNKFEGVSYQMGQNGAPYLTDYVLS
ncbi:MAG: flavin reductase family protein, partial [Desulfotomaculaceae bacterium]|nr:flavin reductase family protein [Desulfotomaculaceae bacterium]